MTKEGVSVDLLFLAPALMVIDQVALVNDETSSQKEENTTTEAADFTRKK